MTERSRIFRVAGILVVCALATVAGAPTGLVDAGASSHDVFHALQHNILKDRDDDVVDVAADPDYLTVALQEVCGYIGTTPRMEAEGYLTNDNVKVDFDGDGGCPTTSQNCGNGKPCLYALAFSRGVDEGVTVSETYSSQLGSDWTNYKVKQGYVCVKASYILRFWWSCSTHLTGNSDTVANAQSNEYRGELWGWSVFDNAALIAAGDFNLKPSQLHANWSYYFNMDDENSAPTYQDTTIYSSLDKIDYVWTDDPSMNHLFGVADIIPATLEDSDHHLVHAAFVWD